MTDRVDRFELREICMEGPVLNSFRALKATLSCCQGALDALRVIDRGCSLRALDAMPA
jgi:hypothetical protein